MLGIHHDQFKDERFLSLEHTSCGYVYNNHPEYTSLLLNWSSITGYGSTLYIGIAMVFVFSPYIRKLASCFQFQVNFIFYDFTAQIMLKIICVPNITLNYHILSML